MAQAGEQMRTLAWLQQTTEIDEDFFRFCSGGIADKE